MRRSVAVGLLGLGLAGPIPAQELTEEQFVLGVGQEHAAVRALQEDLALARAARARAGALSNPRLEFWREQPDANPRVTNWSLAWTPPLDGRLGLGKQAADAAVAAAQEGQALGRVRLRIELRRAYAEWSLATERLALLASQADLLGGLAEAERQRALAGEAPGLSARRLELAEAEARAALRDGEAALARAAATARSWRQDLLPEARPLPATLPDAPAELAGADSPELRQLEHQAASADLEARRAGRYWGFPTLQLGWQRLEDGSREQAGPIFAANWNLPLFDRDRGARAEAQGRGDAARARLELARARVAAELQGGRAAYVALLASARESREAARQSERVVESATASYRAGEASLTDLLDALRAAFATRLRELDVRGAALAAHRTLELAAGRPLAGGAQ